MDILPVAGYLAALLIGIVMGVTGSGGSVMAIPVLNYLFLMNINATTTHALFVVAVSSTAGVLLNMRKGNMEWSLVLLFASPMIVAVYLVRTLLLPAIPDILVEWHSVSISRDLGITLFFCISMAAASVYMIADTSLKEAGEHQKYRLTRALLASTGIGAATGITGIGGGFLIVPALSGLLRVPMKDAISTSLLIVAVKSYVGFIGDLESVSIEWRILLRFTAIAVIGMLLGVHFSDRIPEKGLKKKVGWLILLLACVILYKELF